MLHYIGNTGVSLFRGGVFVFLVRDNKRGLFRENAYF